VKNGRKQQQHASTWDSERHYPFLFPYVSFITKKSLPYLIATTSFIGGVKSSIYVLNFVSCGLNMTYDVYMWLPFAVTVRS